MKGNFKKHTHDHTSMITITTVGRMSRMAAHLITARDTTGYMHHIGSYGVYDTIHSFIRFESGVAL